jgi:multidrug resistance efflux pump
LIVFAGCTDLKPIQAQIDDLKSQVSKLQADTAKASSQAAAAQVRCQRRSLGRRRRAEHCEPGAVARPSESDGD